MIEVPPHVENEAAYIAGAERRIAANAAKGRKQRFEAANPDHAEIRHYVYDRSAKSSFYASIADSMDQYGAPSPKQLEIIRRDMASFEAKKAEWAEKRAAKRAAEAELSEWVGEVGKRVEWTLTIDGHHTYEGEFGLVHIYILKDEAGNVVVYKGSSCLGVETERMTAAGWKTSDWRSFDKGDKVTGKATIKTHTTREGVKQTMISRPKFVEAR